jgi:hypothetical protein
MMLQWFQGIADAVRNGFSGLWLGYLELADTVASWFLELVASVVEWVVAGFSAFVVGLASLLPEASSSDHAGVQSGVNELAWVNSYLPISESLALLVVWGVIFAGIGVVKLIRMVSPVSS